MDSDKFRGEVIFTFDGDAAGQRALDRADKFESDFVTQTMFALQPGGLDPCDLRLKQGEAAVRDLIAQRVPLYEFVIRGELGKHNLDTNEGRLAALDAAAAIIGRIKDFGLRDRYAISLDRWLGMMDEDFVLARVRAHAPSAPGSRRSGRAASGGENGYRRGPARPAPRCGGPPRPEGSGGGAPRGGKVGGGEGGRRRGRGGPGVPH